MKGLSLFFCSVSLAFTATAPIGLIKSNYRAYLIKRLNSEQCIFIGHKLYSRTLLCYLSVCTQKYVSRTVLIGCWLLVVDKSKTVIYTVWKNINYIPRQKITRFPLFIALTVALQTIKVTRGWAMIRFDSLYWRLRLVSTFLRIGVKWCVWPPLFHSYLIPGLNLNIFHYFSMFKIKLICKAVSIYKRSCIKSNNLINGNVQRYLKFHVKYVPTPWTKEMSLDLDKFNTSSNM